MDHESAITELASQADALIRAAYERGFTDGGNKMRDTIFAVVTSASVPGAASTPTVFASSVAAVAPELAPKVTSYRRNGAEEARSRAPKGAIDEVLDLVVESNPGLTTQEVEREVLALDPRIGVKSVYNRLRYFERSGRKFKRTGGRWYLSSHSPLIGSPRGETSDLSAAGPPEDPRNGFTPEGGGVGAPPEAGGT